MESREKSTTTTTKTTTTTSTITTTTTTTTIITTTISSTTLTTTTTKIVASATLIDSTPYLTSCWALLSKLKKKGKPFFLFLSLARLIKLHQKTFFPCFWLLAYLPSLSRSFRSWESFFACTSKIQFSYTLVLQSLAQITMIQYLY